MIEAVLGLFVRIVWFVLAELIGYPTGRAAIRAVSLGRLDVADFGYHNQNSIKPFWYHGRQPVVSFWVAIGLGQLLWLGGFAGAIIYVTR